MSDAPNSTSAAEWRGRGEPDPHGTSYDCERAALTLGALSDDELANGVFLHGNEPLDVRRVLAKDPTYHSSIVWLTAAKERIRWLSRALVRAPNDAVIGDVANFLTELVDCYSGNGEFNNLTAPLGTQQIRERAIELAKKLRVQFPDDDDSEEA